MVKKLIKFFSRESTGLHDAAYVLAFFAILSQLLALARDRMFAHYFGAGVELDIYYAAFRIPDFIFVTVASIVSISVIVPFLSEWKERGRDIENHNLNAILNFFILTIAVISFVILIFLPQIAPKIFPGFEQEVFERVITLTRIMLLQPILLGISNLLGSVAQVYRKFLLYSISPLFYNLGIIFGIIFLYPKIGLAGLAWGVVVGAFAHMLVQYFAVRRIGFALIAISFDWSTIKNVLVLSVPRSLTLSLQHFVLLIYTAFATLMPVGSLAVLNFSLNLQSVPLSIIGVSYSMAAFATLSVLYAQRKINEFAGSIETALKHILFWCIPASVLFLVLRAYIVRVVLGSGAFDWSDTRLVAAVLSLFIISAAAQSAILLLIRAFYAIGRTAWPLYANIFSAVLGVFLAILGIRLFNIYPAFGYFLESLLDISDLSGTVIIMLPIAYSISSIFCAILLFIRLRKEVDMKVKPIIKTISHTISAGVIGGALAYGTLTFSGKYFALDTLASVFLQGLAAGVVGILGTVIILKILDNKEIDEVTNTLRHKFWKSKVVAADQNLTLGV